MILTVGISWADGHTWWKSLAMSRRPSRPQSGTPTNCCALYERAECPAFRHLSGHRQTSWPPGKIWCDHMISYVIYGNGEVYCCCNFWWRVAWYGFGAVHQVKTTVFTVFTGWVNPPRAPRCIHPVQIAPDHDRYQRLLPGSSNGTHPAGIGRFCHPVLVKWWIFFMIPQFKDVICELG